MIAQTSVGVRVLDEVLRDLQEAVFPAYETKRPKNDPMEKTTFIGQIKIHTHVSSVQVGE